MVDYFTIIHKYIPPNSPTYRIYLPHVSMVTAKALQAARKLNLSLAQQRFIEEAAMLHDIGIIQVKDDFLRCNGHLPYLCHGVEGRKILENENLPLHALVAERHTGVGISRKEIIRNKFPLPKRDLLARSIEEKIISWADLYYGKGPNKLWVEKAPNQIKAKLMALDEGEKKVKRFNKWLKNFG